jgi:hypothetical protein
MGFQKKKGTKPHFKNIENIKKNHAIETENISQKPLEIIK